MTLIVNYWSLASCGCAVSTEMFFSSVILITFWYRYVDEAKESECEG